MALETGTYINSLVAANPPASDGLSQGDDHLRLIKAVILATFANITGAVTGTHTQLNTLTSATYPFVAASIADDAVTTTKILNLNVTAAKLAADAVTTLKILDANVTTTKLALLAVTAAQIAADAVTTAKILDRNVTTTKIALLGVTAAELAADAVTTAKILDANVTDAKLALPGATKRLAAATAATSAQLAFTASIDSTYRSYVFEFDNILPATDDRTLQMFVSDDGGSSYKSTTYKCSVAQFSGGGVAGGLNPTTFIPLSGNPAGNGVANTAGLGFSGKVTLFTPSNATTRKHILVEGGYMRGNGVTDTGNVIGSAFWNGGNAAINAVKFMFDSGNIASGTITMYGIKG